MSKVKLFWDMDGTLAKSSPDVKISDFYRKDYFLELEPETSLCLIADSLARHDEFESYILTSVMDGAVHARSEKLRWLNAYVTGIKKTNILFVPYGVRKSAFIEDLFHCELSENDILVDDHSPNLIAWENAGGKAVKWVNDFNNKGNSTFSGARIKKANEVRTIVNAALTIQNNSL